MRSGDAIIPSHLGSKIVGAHVCSTPTVGGDPNSGFFDDPDEFVMILKSPANGTLYPARVGIQGVPVEADRDVATVHRRLDVRADVYPDRQRILYWHIAEMAVDYVEQPSPYENNYDVNNWPNDVSDWEDALDDFEDKYGFRHPTCVYVSEITSTVWKHGLNYIFVPPTVSGPVEDPVLGLWPSGESLPEAVVAHTSYGDPNAVTDGAIDTGIASIISDRGYTNIDKKGPYEFFLSVFV